MTLEQIAKAWSSWSYCGGTVFDSAAIGEAFFRVTSRISAGICDAIPSEYVEVACMQRRVSCVLEMTELRRNFDLFASAQSSAPQGGSNRAVFVSLPNHIVARVKESTAVISAVPIQALIDPGTSH
jgi:hypothetical protein